MGHRQPKLHFIFECFLNKYFLLSFAFNKFCEFSQIVWYFKIRGPRRRLSFQSNALFTHVHNSEVRKFLPLRLNTEKNFWPTWNWPVSGQPNSPTFYHSFTRDPPTFFNPISHRNRLVLKYELRTIFLELDWRIYECFVLWMGSSFEMRFTRNWGINCEGRF